MASDPQLSTPFRLDRMMYFLGTLSLFWVLGGLYCLGVGYHQSFILLNAFRLPLADAVMPHFTHLGDGLLLSCTVGFFLMPDKRAELVNLIVTLILSSFFISLAKSYLFSDWYRPLKVFEQTEEIFYISLDRLTRRSFPSGHSAAAGVILSFAAFVWEKQRRLFGVLLGLTVIGISYSRLYIGVHFLGDILVGSFVGVAFAVLGIFLFQPRLTSYFSSLSVKNNRHWTLGLYIFLVLVGIGELYRLMAVYYWERILA